MKDERGVTMIALGVTILVLSIITAVSISQLVLGNSVFVKQMVNETDYQEEMIREEEDKINNVIDEYEEEWGLS